MGSVNETIKNVNTTVRTMLMAAVVGGAGLAGYHAYDLVNTPKKALAEREAQLKRAEAQVNDLQTRVAEQSVALDKLNASLRLLKVDQRIATLEVLDQTPAADAEGEGDGDGDEGVITRVRFVETDPTGKEIGRPKEFTLPGERVYLEYLVVKFDDAYVERADLQRGSAICLFQRVFGSGQTPDQGFLLDEPNVQPTAYAAGGAVSDFERGIWRDFWNLAHDPDRMASMGVRAMQGNAPFYRVRPGEKYRVELRTTGDFNMRNLKADEPAPREGAEDGAAAEEQPQ